jgi:acetyl-CoA C-acetyltransferase
MSPNPRASVIVGVSQHTYREPDLTRSPHEMIVEAILAAAHDAEARHDPIGRASGLLLVGSASKRHPHDPRAVSQALSIAPAEVATSAGGGSSPGILLSHAASAVQAGEHDLVIIAGGEALATQAAARRSGEPLSWPQVEDFEKVPRIGNARKGWHPAEAELGFTLPTQMYALMENAVYHRSGRSLKTHMVGQARLWEQFADVARHNEFAAIRTGATAEQILRVDAANRMVCSPYPKLMTANPNVDMAAALILTSRSTAEDLGIPRDRWVFVETAAHAHDHWSVGERALLGESPAIEHSARAALAASEVSIADVKYIDLYSCFPVAVTAAARAVGLQIADRDRPPTMTGGLTFAGGPGNNYSTHALAASVLAIRHDPDERAVVTANGWYLTDHWVGVLAGRPPARAFTDHLVQDTVDVLPRKVFDPDLAGEVLVEACTVEYDKTGRQRALISCLSSDQTTRAWAYTTDPDAMSALGSDSAPTTAYISQRQLTFT